ncbi:MAG: metal ABC transporter permease [Rhodospirillales bacterium]
MAIACAIRIATFSSVLGLLVGYHLTLPPGPIIIMIAVVLFALSFLFSR